MAPLRRIQEDLPTITSDSADIVTFTHVDSLTTYQYSLDVAKGVVTQINAVGEFNYNSAYEYMDTLGLSVLKRVLFDNRSDMSRGGYVFQNIVINGTVPTIKASRQVGHAPATIQLQKGTLSIISPEPGRIAICNASGRILFSTISTGKAFSWAGTTFSGAKVPAGSYILVCTQMGRPVAKSFSWLP